MVRPHVGADSTGSGCVDGDMAWQSEYREFEMATAPTDHGHLPSSSDSLRLAMGQQSSAVSVAAYGQGCILAGLCSRSTYHDMRYSSHKPAGRSQ